MNFSSEFTQDPQQNINLVQILIKRKLIEPFEKLSRESVECYNLQKGTKEANNEYATRVNKCLDSWQKHFERVEDHTNKYLSNLRAKEALHFSKLFHCSNAINDKDIDACRKEENHRFATELKETFSQL